MTSEAGGKIDDPACSFCALPAPRCRVLVVGSVFSICAECLRLGVDINEQQGVHLDRTTQRVVNHPGTKPQQVPFEEWSTEITPIRGGGAGVRRCSFCAKTRNEVRALMIGPGVAICNLCIQIAVDTCARAGHAI